MWPFDRSNRDDVLRVCRGGVEHWTRTSAGLTLHRRETFERPMDVVALEDAIVRLFSGNNAPPVRPQSVHIVIESPWLPIMLLAPSAELGNVGAIERRLRECLAELYDAADDPVARWLLQVDGLPGDRHVCGYGLPTRVRECIPRALSATHVHAASLQPAWAWARTQHSQRATRRHTGWWLWQESDRTLVAGMTDGRVTSLHPGLPTMDKHFDAPAVVAVEAARIGSSTLEPIIAGGWHAPPTLAKRVRWLGVDTPLLPQSPQASAIQESLVNPASR